MITAKINVTRINKEYLFVGKHGKYLDLVIWANKNGPDQYGNTHTICQGVPKEARDSGVRGAIIGNLKWETSAAKPNPPADIPAETDNHDPVVPF